MGNELRKWKLFYEGQQVGGWFKGLLDSYKRRKRNNTVDAGSSTKAVRTGRRRFKRESEQ